MFPPRSVRLLARPRLACCVYLALLSLGAHADDADPPGQIVVTAQKRDERQQSVPISMTAVSEQTLARTGVDSLADLARQAPGLSVVSSGPGQNILIVRGISSTAGTAGTVGYYLDDTPISASSNASLLSLRGLIDPSVFDIARVEVLRGPQGTLYGSSSMGGTVKYVTHQPDRSQTETRLTATLSDTQGGGLNRAANAMFNLPLGDDRAALRFSVFHRHMDGFIDREPIDPNHYLAALPGGSKQSDVNAEETTGARASLKVWFDDRLSVTSSVFYQQTHLGAPFQIDAPPGTLDHLVQTRLVPEPSTQRSTLANIAVHKGFDDFELVSSSSYYDRRVQVTEDTSKVLYYFFSPAPQTYVYPGVMTGEYINKEFTQEFRLVSSLSGPFEWIGGLFYHHVNAPLASTIPLPPGYDATFGTHFGPTFGTFFQGARQASVRETALFGEAAYHLTSTVTGRVGLRAFEVTQGFAQQGDGVFNGGPTAVNSSSKDHGLNPKLNLAWQITPDAMVYATAAKGYRPGGPNNPAPAAVCGAEVAKLGLSSDALQKFGADSLWNYEVGAKTSWLDRRLTLNGALYYIDWRRVQQQIVLQCGFNITANFGSATSQGGELEASYQATRQLNLHLAASYTDARLNNDVPGTAAKQGDTLLDVPRWTAGTAAEYTLPLTGGRDGYGRVDYTYTGAANTLYDRSSPFYRRQGFGQVNLRLGLHAKEAGRQWDAALFIDNALNKIGETGLPVAISADLPTTRRIAVTRPRTVGVTLSDLF